MTVVKINRITKEKTARKKVTQIGEVTMQRGRGSLADIWEIDLPNQHIIEVELDNGLILFRHADEIGEEATQRGTTGDTQLILPQSLPQGGSSRGLGALAVRAYRFFSGSGLGRKAALASARALEQKPRKLDGWPRNAAYQDLDVLLPLSRDGGFEEFDTSLVERDGAEILVLVHGTASSTMGSFGPIVNNRSNGHPSPGTTSQAQWKTLCQRFADPKKKGRSLIYGFEHSTLTRSPVQNAIALLESLPRNAKLHVLSHSRGGLVGELLTLSPEMLNQDDLDWYAGSGLPRGDLEKLKKLIAFKAPQVQQFVRVAAPMQGTLLNSDRIGTTFSLLFNLMKIVPGGQNLLADAFREFAREFIATRKDVSVLPGLAAMSPDSALVAILNRANRIINSPLTIVSGDIEPSGILRSLAVFATDLFYREDHDLVVNTRAMLSGVPRTPNKKLFRTRGIEVNHFSYFSNKTSSKAIVDALTGVANDALELLAPEPEESDLISGTRGAGADKPLVFVLPGIMGSHLRVKGQDTPIWFNIPRIVVGGLQHITSRNGKIIPNVESAGVLRRFYGRLVRFLSRSHEVSIFDYDWRKPLADEADRLAARVRMERSKLPAGQKRPIRFVGHSMGGLVVRLMINRHRDLWQDLRADGQGGSTLVMLGTPNRGSMSIVWAFMGLDKLIHNINLIDRKHDIPELVEKIAPLPGILELLPFDGGGTYFDTGVWQQLRTAKGGNWPIPDGSLLKKAGQTHTALDLKPDDAQGMSYIAGKADMTPAALDSTTLKMTGSRHGDGRVLWRTGLLPDVATWYAYHTSHGDLAKDRNLFGSILDLLQTGNTQGLPQTPPVERGGAPLFEVEEPETLYPSQEDAEEAIMGATGMHDPQAGPERRDPCKVSVMHGDLRLHSDIVTVGCYENEPIEGVERDIDDQLGGQLTQRRALGVFPGAERTAELFLRNEPIGEFATGIEGALVVGLGRFGELSRRRLSVTLANAFVLYALRTGPTERGGKKQLTTLPISSSNSQLSITDSVESILAALQNANNRLPRDYRIMLLTILELYEDRAIEVGSALSRMHREGCRSQDFAIDCNIRTGVAGRQRFRFGPDTTGNRRMQITVPCSDSLNFVVFDQGALAQKLTTRVKRSRIDSLIEKATSNTYAAPDTGKLLYEWVIPKELRALTSDNQNMTLLVDSAAAAYPWEMLQDNWAEGGKPLAVEARMTRQLMHQRNGLGSNVATSRRVLVIGDPVSFFSELPGAQAEAKLVAEKLKKCGWPRVKDVQIRENVDVERALTLQENQVLHFAGHGVFEWGDAKQTGLITGKARVLEPAFIEKLRYVPEFVFLNCCYGGAIGVRTVTPEDLGEGRERRTPHEALLNRPDLASGIAMKFIEAGSKAVIAAGWAVDDNMAYLFAETFYDAFLNGDSFAEAVQRARAKVYEAQPEGNTWSAYQAYGDPAFRLQQRTSVYRSEWVKPEFVSRRQATLTLRALKLDARFAPTANKIAPVAEQFTQMLQAVVQHSNWGNTPELFEAIADVYAELGRYRQAILYYERAIRRSPPTLSLNALENLMSLRVRRKTDARIKEQQSAGKAKTKIEKARKQEEKTILAEIAYLEQQEEIAGEHSAALRQTRIGDSYLRLAACVLVGSPSRPTIVGYLQKARDAYDTAVTHGFLLPEFDAAYPLIRRAFADFLLHCSSNAKQGHSIDELMPLVNRVAQDLREADARQTQFQRRRLIAETRLFELVVTGVSSDPVQKELLDVYGQLFLYGGSIRRRREVVSDLYTVAQLLDEIGKLPNVPLNTTVSDTVETLASELKKSIPKIPESILSSAEETTL